MGVSRSWSRLCGGNEQVCRSGSRDLGPRRVSCLGVASVARAVAYFICDVVSRVLEPTRCLLRLAFDLGGLVVGELAFEFLGLAFRLIAQSSHSDYLLQFPETGIRCLPQESGSAH